MTEKQYSQISLKLKDQKEGAEMHHTVSHTRLFPVQHKCPPTIRRVEKSLPPTHVGRFIIKNWKIESKIYPNEDKKG